MAAGASLVRLGSLAEAMQHLDWVLGVLDDCPSPERLQPVYTLTGEQLGPEAEIAELSGYRGSRPVRVGNMASRQVQLDVFDGEGGLPGRIHAHQRADCRRWRSAEWHKWLRAI